MITIIKLQKRPGIITICARHRQHALASHPSAHLLRCCAPYAIVVGIHYDGAESVQSPPLPLLGYGGGVDDGAAAGQRTTALLLGVLRPSTVADASEETLLVLEVMGPEL